MATDQEIQDRGIKFLPKQQYLQSPYQFNEPVVEEEEVTESFGIPNTNAFTNSNSNNYTGGSFDLNNFQKTLDARQSNLNRPTDTSTFMSRTMGKVKDFMEPQSANQIMTDGYQEPRFQPGIIATIMGKLDNYRNLSRADQAFIAQNMGYTGPTVFGENNSGLGKDPFGINTRSAKGNYANYVDKKSIDLTDTLTKKGGKIFNKYAVDPITGQVLDEEEFSYDPVTGQYIGTNAAAIAKANQMNKMNLTKLGFYNNKKKESMALRMQEEMAKEERDRDIQNINTRLRNEDANITDRRESDYSGSVGLGSNANNVRSAMRDNDPDTGSAQSYNQNLAEGGRAGYFFGGRARLQGGGGADMGAPEKAAERASKGYGTAPDTGSKSGTNDYSTTTQTENNDRSIRDNQKEKPSTIDNVMNLGSELSYLNNLKNFNVPGIALNFGINRFRNYMKNKNLSEEDKFSYNTNPLPTDNYFAEVKQKDLDASKMKGFKKQDYPSYKDQMDMLGGTTVSPYEFKGLQDGTITTTGTFTAANGGRAMFKNGGLASIL